MTAEVVTAGAAVAALLVSMVLGATSIRMTLADRKAARDERESRAARLSLDIGLRSDGRIVGTWKNDSPGSISEIVAHAWPYDTISGRPLESEHGKNVSVTVGVGFPLLLSSEKKLRLFDPDQYRYVGLATFTTWAWTGSFRDHTGQVWSRHPSGRLEKYEDFRANGHSLDKAPTMHKSV